MAYDPEYQREYRKKHSKKYRSYLKDYYRSNKGKWPAFRSLPAEKKRNKSESIRRSAKRRYEENRHYFLRQIGGCCESCGYKEYPEILEFDHINPDLKDRDNRSHRGNFSTMLRRYTIRNPTLWNDFHNVMVLCPNCHRIKTYKNNDWVYGRQIP